MEQIIEVVVQPPSPRTPIARNDSLNQRKGIGSMLPPVNNLFTLTTTAHIHRQELPRIKLTIDTDLHHPSPALSTNLPGTTTPKKLETIEPDLNKWPSNISSPLLFSSPSPSPVTSPSTSLFSPIPSPLYTPSTSEHSPGATNVNDTSTSGVFLLPPPAIHSKSSDSPLCSPLSLSPLCLSPPSPNTTTHNAKESQLSLFPSLSITTTTTTETAPSTPTFDTCPYDSIFQAAAAPVKRKRGRPPNASRLVRSSEPVHPTSWTFVEPTVWNVKHNQREVDLIKRELEQVKNQDTQLLQQQYTTSDRSKATTTFSTDLIMDLNIPKKKRGRKPKQHMVGNGCFVWKDLTAPRGANKKKERATAILTSQKQKSL